MESAPSQHTSDAGSSEKPAELLAGSRVTVFLPVNLHAWVRAEAAGEGMRISTYIRRLVIADRNAKRETE